MPDPETHPGAPVDLAIIGGGINGCGIARDAAGRGASVALFEKGDLASGTSSASTKLIHGGLRYLEHREFRLVREALAEREVLWGIAPHIVWPIRFVLPHQPGLRPLWLIRAGLFLYDHLGGRRRLPATRLLDLADDPAGRALKPGFARGFEYSDCWVEDSRLVVLNAADAAERGATIRPRTRVVGASRRDGFWEVAVEAADGGPETWRARALVDAAGPWVGSVLAERDRPSGRGHVRLVQGSHIVVRRLVDHDRAYLFQNGDGRIVFAIPYERDFTLIGTTDRDYAGDPAAVAASEDEILYLCRAASEYFAKPIAREDVVWTYSGVRPLYDDGTAKAQEATRDYVLELDAPGGAPPLLSVFGGKITTYRRLAEAALERLRPALPVLRAPTWTATAPLPGGDFPPDGYGALVEATLARHPGLPRPLVARLVRAYGTRSERLLDGAQDMAALGPTFGADLSAREVDYLVAAEWAASADDILWRRSKLGLRVGPADRAALAAYLADTLPAEPAPLAEAAP